jgi:hypothetical protein
MAGMLTVAAAISKAGVLIVSLSTRLLYKLNSRLVTTGQQDYTVDWVAKENLYQGEIRQISIQHGSRSLGSLLDRVTGELERCTAIGDNTVSNSLGKGNMVGVTGSEIRPGLGDTDNRLLLVCQLLHYGVSCGHMRGRNVYVQVRPLLRYRST